MIKDVATLLYALQQKEMEIIRRSGIEHAPTIGNQYEGLTSTLLKQMIPEGLQLQVVNGFVEGIDGTLTGQIDCMLVRGTGIPVPHTNCFKWPVRDVLAVFEVKKSLFAAELKDAHEQLRGVLDKFLDYAENLTAADQVDISPALHAYGQIVGEPAPQTESREAQPFYKETILRTLIAEQIAPLRIVFGYYGYSSEYALRAGFLKFLRKHMMRSGYAGTALPTLIICGQNSVIKANGFPYCFPLQNGQWLCYESSSQNPLLILLNIILFKFSCFGWAPDWFARDLSIEQFAPLLWGRAVKDGEHACWYYTPSTFTREQLETVPTSSSDEWRPMTISQFQFSLLGTIGNQGLSREVLKEITTALEIPAEQAEREIEELVQNRLVGWSNHKLVFLTRRCASAFTPWGEAIAGDVEDERLFQWMQQEGERRRNAESKAPTD